MPQGHLVDLAKMVLLVVGVAPDAESRMMMAKVLDPVQEPLSRDGRPAAHIKNPPETLNCNLRLQSPKL